MNRSMVAGIAIGIVVASAGGAIAGYSILNDEDEPTHAEVVNVEEVRETVSTPREVCQPVQVTRQKPVQDQHQVLGTVAGAVIGGVIGNQVGGGSGKKVATVAGAAAGGYAGNKTQERMQTNNTYQTTETRCETVMDQQQVLKGYQVDYRIGEKEGSVFMDHDPGSHIPLNDGQLVLSR
ncbi:MAG: glycine zipper 2TM domain-containing protein [Porticoccaceae bacterium]|nr:glycine zipper 2TM domain-containing protein [Porticoccaceae bacterium]